MSCNVKKVQKVLANNNKNMIGEKFQVLAE